LLGSLRDAGRTFGMSGRFVARATLISDDFHSGNYNHG
jgi:hypothetical protein